MPYLIAEQLQLGRVWPIPRIRIEGEGAPQSEGFELSMGGLLEKHKRDIPGMAGEEMDAQLSPRRRERSRRQKEDKGAVNPFPLSIRILRPKEHPEG